LLVAVMLIGGFVAGSGALAQETTWQPPEPSPESKDWIKLKSGEWLRGNIDLFRDVKLYFDSDELDDLEIDWGDIAEIRSPQILTFTFEKGGVVTGTCSMRDGIVKIDTGTGVREFERSDLLSILEGKPRELNYWSLKATLGVIARAGNSEQADATSFLRLRREATRSRFDTEYTGNMGSVQKEQNVNNHRFSTNFNIFMSRRLFLTPVGIEIYADKFQNIDYRATIGAGVGYYLWRQNKFDWFLQLGGAYQSVQYISVQAGEDQRVDNGAIIPILSIEWDITSDIEFELNYNSQIGVPDTKNAFHYLFALLSIELSEYLDLDTSLQWDHNENPVADADGNIPKRDDFRLSFGLGVDI
jgi:putative salt-induced outer membrane protein YdiY